MANTFVQRGILVVVSDFCDDPDEISEGLGFFRAQGHDVVAFQVPVDPEASLLRLAGSGIWEIRPPGERPEHPMAVAANVDVTESDMTRMDVEEFLGAVGGEPGIGEAAPDTTAADASAAELQAADFEGRQSFWRYLLAAAFLLMVSETVLANGLSRRRIRGD